MENLLGEKYFAMSHSMAVSHFYFDDFWNLAKTFWLLFEVDGKILIAFLTKSDFIAVRVCEWVEAHKNQIPKKQLWKSCSASFKIRNDFVQTPAQNAFIIESIVRISFTFFLLSQQQNRVDDYETSTKSSVERDNGYFML